MIEKKFFCLKALVLGWKNNNKKYAPRLALLLVLCDQSMLECFLTTHGFCQPSGTSLLFNCYSGQSDKQLVAIAIASAPPLRVMAGNCSNRMSQHQISFQYLKAV